MPKIKHYVPLQGLKTACGLKTSTLPPSVITNSKHQTTCEQCRKALGLKEGKESKFDQYLAEISKNME